ncbi:hypothetical protein pb186bvf_015136 [Paramecium bursaria]
MKYQIPQLKYQLMRQMILFENQNILILNKQCGWSSQGGNNNQNLPTLLQCYFKHIYIVHRLDQSASGVLLIAKTKDMSVKLGQLFENKNNIDKKYQVLCKGMPKSNQGIIDVPLEFNTNRQRMDITSFDKGLPARTEYKVLERYKYLNKNYSLLNVQIYQGRKHQIRAHLSQVLGLDILYDKKYYQLQKSKDDNLESRFPFKDCILLHCDQILIKELKLMKKFDNSSSQLGSVICNPNDVLIQANKWSERLFFVGNLTCFCQINENDLGWQPRRIVVTDQSIYYFQATQSQIKKSTIQEWSQHKLTNQTIPQLQGKTADKKSYDYDQITSPPLVIQSVIDKFVHLIRGEDFISYAQRKAIPIPNGITKVICLTNKATKEVQFMISSDGQQIQRAVTIANAIYKWKQFCQQTGANQRTEEKYVNFLQECINTESPLLVIDKADKQEKINIFKHLIESSNLMEGLKFQPHSDIKHFQVLISAFKVEQLQILDIKNCGISIKNISDFVGAVQNLTQLISLNLSQNQIDDKCLDLINRIFENCNEIKIINLEQNNIQGQDFAFEIFIMKVSQLLLFNLELNLGQNQLTDQSISVIENRILYDETCQIKSINLDYNKFTKTAQVKMFKIYLQIKEKRDLKITFYPLPFSLEIIKTFYKQIQIEEGSMIKSVKSLKQDNKTDLSIQKRSNTKLPVTTTSSLQQIRQKEKEIRRIFQSEKNDPSVEQVYEICQQLDEFPYQMPQKIILQIQEWVWNKLNDAILIRDHYAISYLTFAAFYLQTDNTIFQERYFKLAKRIQLLEDRINRLLNFEIQEINLNQELDNLLGECHRLDIRGQPVDFLIALKLERDENIKQLIINDYDWYKDSESFQQEDINLYLTRDIDKIYAEVNLNIIDPIFFKHHTIMNYLEISKYQFDNLQQFWEKMKKLKTYQNIFQDKSLISTFNLDDYIKENSVVKYYIDQSIHVLEFLLHDYQNNFDYLSWKENIINVQLNAVRLLITYFSYKIRRQQIRQRLEKKNLQYQEFTYDQIIKDIDINRQQATSEIRFSLSDIRISVYDPEIIITQSQRQSISNTYQFIGNNKNNILNIDDEYYNFIAQEIKNQVKIIIIESVALQQNLDVTQLLLNLQSVIDICNNSPCPSLFGDEVLLQFYAYINSEKTLSLLKVFTTLINYIPPSLQLLNYLQNWILNFELVEYQRNHQYHYIKKRIIYLLNNWQSNNQMPFWIPSLIELNCKLKCQEYYEAEITQIDDEQDIKQQITEIMTVGQFVNSLKLDHNYWIYLRVYKNDQIKYYNNSSNDKNIIEDIALINDLNMFYNISQICMNYPSIKNNLVIKQRIFPNVIQDQKTNKELESFNYLVDSFLSNQNFGLFYDNQLILFISSILFILNTKQDVENQIANIMKSKRQEDLALDKIKGEIKVNTKFQDYIPTYVNINEEQLDQKDPKIQKLKISSINELKDLFQSILLMNPCTFKSNFKVKVNNVSLIMTISIGAILLVNQQKLYNYIDYKYVVGISISQSQMRIVYYENQLDEFIISFKFQQSFDCYLDILSYLRLRIQIPLNQVYAISDHYRFIFKNQIFGKDQVQIVQKLLELKENKFSELFQQYYITQQFQVNGEYQNVYQENCPLFEVDYPKTIQSQDISKYFQKDGKQQLRTLLEPYRELFPNIFENSRSSSISRNTPRHIKNYTNSVAASKKQSMILKTSQIQDIQTIIEQEEIQELAALSEVVSIQQESDRQDSENKTKSDPNTERSKFEQYMNFEYQYLIPEVSEDQEEQLDSPNRSYRYPQQSSRSQQIPDFPEIQVQVPEFKKYEESYSDVSSISYNSNKQEEQFVSNKPVEEQQANLGQSIMSALSKFPGKKK